jgi:hypothetical protein
MSEEGTYWLIILAVIALVFWALVRDNARVRNRTREEYEQDVLDAKTSMLRAGLLELDKFAGETKQKRAAVEYLKDQDQGQTRAGGKDDDLDRTEPVEQEEDALSADSTEAESRLSRERESSDRGAAFSASNHGEPEPVVGGGEGAEAGRDTERRPRERLRRDPA